MFMVEMTCLGCARRSVPEPVHARRWLLADEATGEPRRFVTRWEAQVAGHDETLTGSTASHLLEYSLIEVVVSPLVAASR